MLEAHRLDGVACRLADDVELALERIGHHDVGAAADEELADHGLDCAHGGRHRHRGVHGDIAPAEHDLAFGAHGALELLLTGQARSDFLGQEYHGHAVLARIGQRDALFCHFFAIERIGDLDQDARTVAHEFVGADSAAMVEVFEDLQALLDDRVASLALDVGHETHAACVVFIRRRIEPLGLGQAGGGRLIIPGRNSGMKMQGVG